MADDDSDVPETGGVFTFGKSRFADNVPNKFWIRSDRVLQVACGDEHTALVAESGRIFTFGANDWGQLGLGHTKPTTKPSCIKSLKKEKVRMVTCGRSFTLVATESGKVFSFGANGDGQCGLGNTDMSVTAPEVIEALENTDIKMMSAGTEHSAALTEDGDVYVWGGGGEGQLGLGPSETEVPKPIQLELDERITCLSCGYYHTALVTESGKLLTFGETEGGKLGLPETAGDTTVPQEVTGIKGKVIWVSCGGSHTVAVTDDGNVYSFGDGSNGQLGHGTSQLSCDAPQQIPGLKKHKIKWASCGENHTALISAKGAMLTFGDGRHGKLGLGEENFANQFKPSQVTRFDKFIVEAVSCGGCHMLVLARPRMETGDWVSSSDSEAEEEPAHRLKPSIIDHLRKSEDMDLSGSFSARDRRRGKQDPMGSLNRTLPPLNSSFSGRTYNQPLMSNGTANNSNSLKPVRGVVKIEDVSEVHSAKQPNHFGDGDKKIQEKDEDSSLGSVTQDSEENSETDRKKQREAIREETVERVESLDARQRLQALEEASRPKPQPRLTRIKKKSKKESSESSSESTSDEEEVRKAPRKPVPVTRHRPSPTGREAEQSAEEQEPDHEERKKPKKKVKKKLKDSGDEEESEEEKPKKTKKTVQKVKKKSAAAVGPFGRRKLLDSEDENETGESEKENESDDKKLKKKKADKKKGDIKSTKKDKDESEEDEEEEKLKKKSKKQDQKSSDKEVEDSDEENSEKKKVKIKASDEEEEGEVDGSEKEKKEETKPEPKKKSKLCVIL